jgi:Kae1-associated kinase Bud32
LIESDERENLVIEKIDGKLLKEAFDKNYVKFSEEIGEQIAIMHNNSIIHGDLTTSNMILNKKADKVYFIDFGLSFFSDKFEDKAVDLHLLKEALESKHYKVWQAAFKIVLNSYEKEAKDSKTILNRLKAVEKRGRYRAKKGS